MKTFIYPVFNGVFCQNGKVGILSIINDKANHFVKKVNCKFKSIYHENIPFLRGLEFLIFGTYNFFWGLLQNLSGDKSGKLDTFISRKLDVSSASVFSVIVSLLSLFLSLFLFGFIPAKISLIFAKLSVNRFAKNLVLAICKLLFFSLLLFCFKNIPGINRLYSFNMQANIELNKISKITKCKGHVATSYLNFVVSCFMFNLFFISLLGIEAHFLLKHFLNTLIFVLGCSFVFEILNCLEKSKIRCIILLSSFFVTAKTNQTCNLVVSAALWEKKLLEENVLRETEEKQNEVALSQVLAYVESKLDGKFDENEGKWLVAGVLGKKKNDLKFITSIKKSDEQMVKKVLERRLKGEPLDKIFGKVPFYGLTFSVSKDVLSPRPETELLVEKVIEILKNRSKPVVLDLCTGSGAIAISIKNNIKDASVYATDISESALIIAKENAKKHKIKVNFAHNDMFKGLNKRKKYDIIVSNPPYIMSSQIENLDKEVKNYDPRLALDGGEDGLKFYKIIASESVDFLKKDGLLALEIGFDQGEKVKRLLSKNFKEIKVVKDYSNNDRFVFAKLK